MPRAQQVGNQNDASTELNLSHILIPLPENPTSDQLTRLKAVHALLLMKRVTVAISANWLLLIPLTSRR